MPYETGRRDNRSFLCEERDCKPGRE